MAQTRYTQKHSTELDSFKYEARTIDKRLYSEYGVNQGLRDSNGKGVLTGLTEISDVIGFTVSPTGTLTPTAGELYYQGYNVNDIVKGARDRRFGFEEVTYLLLFGQLPDKEKLERFVEVLNNYRALPENFMRDVIMNAPSRNMMNALQQCVLSTYSYDDNAEDLTLENVLRQSLSLIAKMPLFAAYSYKTYRHYFRGKNLHIRNPKSELSLAENLLQMLHNDGKYTELEAKVLDVALILHAEHGGGNNSTFTTHVVSSTGTDSYSTIAASLGSLKGNKHGGANLKVQDMFADIKEHVKDYSDEEAIRKYLNKILDKKAFDEAGLIYGIGHAVYTESDPRAVILKAYAERLSVEKGMEEEFALYTTVERIGKECIMERRQLHKPVCANVDFFSGFVYTMLGLPKELYTPLFAIARISGWSAHRIEELINSNRIIRPAYKYVGHHRKYRSLDER